MQSVFISKLKLNNGVGVEIFGNACQLQFVLLLEVQRIFDKFGHIYGENCLVIKEFKEFKESIHFLLKTSFIKKCKPIQ